MPVAGPIVQVATPLLEALNKIDLTKTGEKFGNYIRQGIEILYNAFEKGGLGTLGSRWRQTPRTQVDR